MGQRAEREPAIPPHPQPPPRETIPVRAEEAGRSPCRERRGQGHTGEHNHGSPFQRHAHTPERRGAIAPPRQGRLGGGRCGGRQPGAPPPQTPAALVDPPWAVTPQRRRGRLDGPRPSRPLPVAGAARVYAGGHTTPSGECHSATPPPPHPQPPSPTPAPPTQLAPLSKLPAAVTPDAPAARQPSVPPPRLRGAHASRSCNPPRRHRGLGSTPSGGQNGDPPPRPATDRRGGGPRRARKRPSGP